jgi:PAS domain-containing protein
MLWGTNNHRLWVGRRDYGEGAHCYPDDKEAAKKNLEACVQSLGHQKRWEMRKVREDGTLVWVRESAKAVPRSDGSLIALIACEDISDYKRGEQRIAAPRQVRVLSARSARRGIGTWARSGPLGSGRSYVRLYLAPVQRGVRRIRRGQPRTLLDAWSRSSATSLAKPPIALDCGYHKGSWGLSS